MALTLDGAIPTMGMASGSSGVGLGAVGGGIAGLILGSMFSNGGFGGGWGGGRAGGPAANAVASDIVLQPAFQSLQQQIQSLQGQIASGGIHAELGNLQTQYNSTMVGLNNTIASSTAGLVDKLGQLQTATTANNFTTLESINNLGRDITAQNNQNALQQLNSFNNLQFQNAQSTNQIIAQGTAAMAEMARCCCDLRSTILADGSATRALISDLNVQNLRDQLSAANNKVSNNEQNQYLLSTILAHYKPTTVTV